MKLVRTPRVTVGARPGTLVVAEGAVEPRVSYFDYTEKTLEQHDVEDIDSLGEILVRDSVTWVDVQGLGDGHVLRRIGKVFSIHDLVLEDIVNVPQRPKVDSHDEQCLIITRMMREHGGELDREQVSILIGPNYVITFQERYGDVFDPVRERLRRGKGPIRRSGPDYLAFAIFATIVDGYFPVLEQIGGRLEVLEDDVFVDPSPEVLRRVNDEKNLLSVLRRLLWPIRDVAAKLARDENDRIADATRPYFRDTNDSALQAVEIVEAYREFVAGLMNTYLSAAGNRMNEIMKVLTVMASIFIPLTFLAGIYGMNFEQMPELKWPWAYPALLVVMAVTVVAMLVWFRRMGWIGSRDATEVPTAP